MAATAERNVDDFAALDFHTLCNVNGAGLVQYFQKLLKEQPEEQISYALLAAVEAGGIPPDVFGVWLDLARSQKSLTAALQSQSRLTRKRALQRIGNNLKASEWKNTWDLLGGVPGWLQLFKQASREDVQRLVCALQRCHTTVTTDAAKRSQITNLVKALFPAMFPDSPYKKEDERQLDEQYIGLVPLCDADVALHILDTLEESSSSVTLYESDMKLFVLNHFDVCKQRIIDKTVGGDQDDDTPSWPGYMVRPKLLGLLLHDYPPRASTVHPGWSASMDFTYDLLLEYAKTPSSNSFGLNVITQFARPLLKRSVRKRCGTKSHLKIFDAILRFTRSSPTSVLYLGFLSGALGSDIVTALLRLWSQKPDIYEELLVEFFKLGRTAFSPNGIAHCPESADKLRVVDKPLRYRLLRLIHLHCSGDPVDIDRDSDLSRIAEQVWYCEIFILLPRKKATVLLDRLIKATDKTLSIRLWGQLHFNDEWSILSWPKSKLKTGTVDPTLLWLVLNRDCAEAKSEARKKVDDNMNLATKTRASHPRLWHASAALVYSVASADLDLLKTVVDFSKRFVRDPESHDLLFDAENLHLTEHVRLLSGITTSNEETLSTTQVRACVGQANDILRMYLEIACKAMQEPHFRPENWQPILRLISKVLLARISIAEALERRLALTDDQLIDIIWKDTLESYVDMEIRWTKAEFRRLEYANARGPWVDAWIYKSRRDPSVYPGLDLFGDMSASQTTDDDHKPQKEQLSSGTTWFLDQLARRRDDIWRKLRLELNSDVAIIPTCWPPGLPVHFHIPPSKNYSSLRVSKLASMPFLEERVKRLIFISEDEAESPIPAQNLQKAIGPFIENYETCLYVYVVLGLPQGRESRVKEAWDHAITKLNRKFKTEAESITFWHSHFADVLPENKALLKTVERHDVFAWPPKIDEFSLPEDADFSEYNEFNPLEGRTDMPSALTWESTTLDVFLSKASQDVVLPKGYRWKEFSAPSKGTVRERSVFDRGDQRNPENVKDRAPKYKEAAIATALLYLDSRKGGAASLMQEAFPRLLKSQRFPPLLLDADFAADVKNTSKLAIDDLARFIERAPPQLLTAITQASINRLKEFKDDEDANISEINEIAFGCLRLLTKSDQPGIANSLIYDTVINLPESSSWHRQVLNKGLINRVEPVTAFNFLVGFAEHIIDVNESRREKASKSSAGTSTEKVQPFVKVTTVKLVVDLLKSGDVFSHETALKLLFRFLRSFIQIDVRTSLLNAIFQIYTSNPGTKFHEETEKKFLAALEGLVPFVGGLSERYATNDKMWNKIMPEDDLPEIGQETPLWNILILKENNMKLSAHVRNHISRKVLLPSLLKSVEANKRWLSLFAKKHKLDVDMTKYPIGPVSHGDDDQLEEIIKKYCHWLPTEIFDLWHQRQRFNLKQPDEIKAASTMVTKDAKLRESIEGHYWHSAIISPVKDAHAAGRSHELLYYCLRTEKPDVGAPTSLAQIQESVIDLAKIMLIEFPGNTTPWFRFVTQFVFSNRQMNSSSEPSFTPYQLWQRRFKPVVERLQALVSSVRTPAWNQAAMADRRPRFLPDPLDFKLGLLQYPASTNDEEQRQRDVSEYARDLEGVLNWLMKLHPVTYHLRLGKFQIAMSYRFSLCDRAAIILSFGTITEDEQKAEGGNLPGPVIVRVYLASEALKSMSVFDDEELAQDLKSMVLSWCASTNEEIREWGEKAWLPHKWERGEHWDPPEMNQLKQAPNRRRAPRKARAKSL